MNDVGGKKRSSNSKKRYRKQKLSQFEQTQDYTLMDSNSTPSRSSPSHTLQTEGKKSEHAPKQSDTYNTPKRNPSELMQEFRLTPVPTRMFSPK